MVWDWLVQFFIAAVTSYVVGGLLAEFPDDLEADDSDLGSPQSRPGDPIPIVFGTRRIKGINNLWYGSISYEKIKKKYKSGFKSKKVTIGYKYFVAVHNAVCMGFTGMTLRNFWIGEDVAVGPVIAPSNARVTFNKPNLYGGKKQGGGIAGAIRFFNGVDTMQRAPLMTNKGLTDAPFYYDIATYTVSGTNERGGFYIGNSKSMRPQSVEIQNHLFMGDDPDFHDGMDMNVMTCIRAILYAEPRLNNLPLTAIDVPSFEAAEAITAAEGLYISPLWNRPKSAEKMVAQLLKIADGLMYVNPFTGKLTIKLIRYEDPANSVMTFDDTNIKKVLKTKNPEAAKQASEVKFTYTSRNHNYERETITAQNLGAYIEQGQVPNARSVSYLSVTTKAVARIICDRLLDSFSKSLQTLEMEVNREASRLLPGMLVTVDYAPVDVSNTLFRVSNIDYGDGLDSSIKITLLEDRFTDSTALYDNSDETQFSDPIGTATAVVIGAATLIEAPRKLLYDFIDSTGDINDDWMPLALVNRDDDENFFFDIYVDEDANGGAYLTTLGQAFVPTATLESDYPQTTNTNDVSNSIRLENLTTVLNQDVPPAGGNLSNPVRFALIGTEWIMFDDIVDNGDGTYHLTNIERGMFDTPPVEHTAGETVWFVSDDFPNAREEAFDSTVVTTIRLNLDPFGQTGYLGLAGGPIILILRSITGRTCL